jgi:lia operon protein LiaG
MFKKWLILAAILLVIGITGALLTAKPYFSLQNENDKQTNRFQSSKIQSLSISNNAGTIKLAETSGDEIIVETNGPKTSKPVKMETKGDLLSITNEANKTFSLGINFKESSKNITIYLPQKQYERIAVSNAVGEITMNQIDAVKLIVDSEVGNIDMSEISSTSLNTSSELGNISINHYSGKLQVENEIGSIEITTDKVDQSLLAKNEIGDINLTINEDPKNILLSADSEIGSTQIFNKKTGSYMSGDGSTTIQLSTETGSITVNN